MHEAMCKTKGGPTESAPSQSRTSSTYLEEVANTTGCLEHQESVSPAVAKHKAMQA